MELPLRASAAVAVVALAAAGLIACSGGDDFRLGEEDGGDAATDTSIDTHAPDSGDATTHEDAGPDAHGDAGGGDEGDAELDGGADDASDAKVGPDAELDGGDANDGGPLVDAAKDAETPDVNVPDTSVPDANGHDANTPDANSHDANGPDANLPDANLPDANLPDAGEDASDASLTCTACPFACVHGTCTGTCSPGASRCVAQGAEFCTDHGTWNLQVGTCMSSCVSPAGRYLVSADAATVSDVSAGLTWQRTEPPASNDWAQAAAYCAALPALGGQGRLPTRAELEALVMKSGCVPAIDQAAFPASSTTATWTSDVATSGDPYVVDFALGTTTTRPPSAAGATRCVKTH